MFSYLDSVPLNNLKRLLSKDYYKFLLNNPTALNREQTYTALFAIHGYNLLDDVSIRRAIIENLDATIISNLRKTLRFKLDIKPFDLALRFANTRWAPNSKQVIFFKELFGLEDKYLPQYSQAVSSFEEIVPPVKFLIPLFYQSEIIDKIVNIFATQDHCAALVQMPTGAGKTKTILDAIALYVKKHIESNDSINILWVAHTEELCNQSFDSFKNTWNHLGDRPFKIQRFWGRHKVATDEICNTFIVTTYQKLSLLKSNDTQTFTKIKNAVKIIVLDEAHKSTARTYKNFINSIVEGQNKFLIGLTATPGRAYYDESENIELSRLFGKNLIRSDSLGDNPIVKLQELEVLSKIDRVAIATNVLVEFKKNELAVEDIPERILKKLENNNERNQLITNKVIELANSNVKSIIFTCSVQHAKILALNQAINGNPSAFITSDMPKDTRKSTVHLFKSGKIMSIFNFGVLSTGFDVPDLGAVIIARPTSSIVLYSQMIGRGLRGPKMGGSKSCLLIDIKDNYSNFGGVDEVYNYFSGYWRP